MKINKMYVKIKTIVDSKEEKVEKIKEDEYKIWVKFKAEKNMANTRVLHLVNKIFPDKKIRIVSGHHSPSKILSIN